MDQNEPKHTPEPWRAIEWNSSARITIVADTDAAEPQVENGQIVVQYGHTEIAQCAGSLRPGGNEANAERACACVNACTGVPTETLLAAPIGHAAEWFDAWNAYPAAAHEVGFQEWHRQQLLRIDGLIGEVNRLIGQRDELLRSLIDMTPPMPAADASCHAGLCEQSECARCTRIARARAAIAGAQS